MLPSMCPLCDKHDDSREASVGEGLEQVGNVVLEGKNYLSITFLPSLSHTHTHMETHTCTQTPPQPATHTPQDTHTLRSGVKSAYIICSYINKIINQSTTQKDEQHPLLEKTNGLPLRAKLEHCLQNTARAYT